MKQKTLFVTALAALLLAFVTAALLYNAQSGEQGAETVVTNRSALIRMHSPTVGNMSAPVVIVEWLDPACGTCATFYPVVKEMMAANPDQIRLVLRYAPFHQGSDQVVAVLEAARKQGKFWPALEALLATQADWAPHHTAQVALVWKHLEGLDLDFERLRTDMASPAITAVIARDIEDAQTLNVTRTPEFFVNGRPLPSFGYAPLKRLVDDALNAASQR